MARRALLIGINRYLIPGADLRGCVNDVKNIRAALLQYFAFRSGDIKVLSDRAATKKAMQSGIAALVASGRKGDVLYLHYSGHGSNVPDKNGDEADHRDEILCPADLDWKDPLTDDWLRGAFNKLRAGVNLTVVMDCCHSGTNTRAILSPDAPVIPRYLPNPWDLMAEESRRRLRGTVRGAGARAARKRSDVVEAAIGETLFAGCRSTQTSADAYIGRTYNGAMTYSLVAAIQAARGKLTNRELHAATSQRLKAGDFDQVPQLEGRRTAFDRPFLSSLG
ncbi:MAG TPA: caspase family protein [Steroidobacteraceae bacterium]|nr:caspase family protein [Steroidobacteraceae bacterium]